MLNYIEANPTASQGKIAEALGINVNTLKSAIRKYRRNGIIRRVGTSGKGQWIVNLSEKKAEK